MSSYACSHIRALLGRAACARIIRNVERDVAHRVLATTGTCARVSLLAILVFLAGCGDEQLGAEKGEEDQALVYEVRVEVTGVSKARSSGVPLSHWQRFEHTEWLASDGRWRRETRGRPEPGSEDIDETTDIYAGSACVQERSYDDLPTVRIGSKPFLGSCAERSPTARALERYLASGDEPPDSFRVHGNGFEFRATVVRSLTLAEASQGGLFEIPTGERVNLTRELDPGEEPALALEPYWFGPEIVDAVAVRALELRFWEPAPGRASSVESRGESTLQRTLLYTVYYAPKTPRSSDAGLPGKDALPGEIQVGSQPIDAKPAQRTLDVYDGESLGVRYPRVPREKIVLAGGEPATLYFSANQDWDGFDVATESTLVTVVGSFPRAQIPGLATRLRALAASE